MVKLGAIIAVYQEADYLPYALKQAEKHCDEIIVYEGCHSKGHNTRSTDGTIEIIEKSGLEYQLPVNTDGVRYDHFQCAIWQKGVTEMIQRGCDWFRFWDCDMFAFDKDWVHIKDLMGETSKDCIMFNERRFLFNWHINTHDQTGYFYRVTDGMFLSPISRVHSKDGTLVRDCDEMVERMDTCIFHFTAAKKLERMKFRFEISKEKGTPGIDNLWEKYRNSVIDYPADVHENEMLIQELVGGYGENWYDGEYPEVLKDHPYRFCNDIRDIK